MCANNAMNDTPKEIFEKLILLKHQIEKILPKCEVTISELIMWMDEPKTAKINEEVNRLIKSANINFVKIVISKENSLVNVVYIWISKVTKSLQETYRMPLETDIMLVVVI